MGLLAKMRSTRATVGCAKTLLFPQAGTGNNELDKKMFQ
jgi:hypothetical protein